MSKNVLSHTERNKVIKIPQDKEISYGKRVSQVFHVTIAVSFHKFSVEWDDRVRSRVAQQSNLFDENDSDMDTPTSK